MFFFKPKFSVLVVVVYNWELQFDVKTAFLHGGDLDESGARLMNSVEQCFEQG